MPSLSMGGPSLATRVPEAQRNMAQRASTIAMTPADPMFSLLQEAVGHLRTIASVMSGRPGSMQAALQVYHSAAIS